MLVEFTAALTGQMANVLSFEVLLKVRIDCREVFDYYRGASIREGTHAAAHIQHLVEYVVPRCRLQFALHVRRNSETSRALVGLELVVAQRQDQFSRILEKFRVASKDLR